MGKGDRRSRRGKIYAGSFGKSRPKAGKAVAKKAPAATSKKK
jgi:30S ribosomal protein S31